MNRPPKSPPCMSMNRRGLSHFVWSCTGVYAASKHAIEAIGDALRQELMYDGVSVSLIEPGFVDTPILRKVCSATPSVHNLCT